MSTSDPGHGEHASVATYIKVALVLTALTGIEVGAIYIRALTPILIPTLLVLSLAKFSLVLLFFMHLRYDTRTLSVVFVGIHVVTAVVDPYAAVGVVAVVVPFVGAGNPLWVGLGAVSLDLIAALIVSSLLRRHVGYRPWRAIHWLAYMSWPVALAHGLGMGSDASSLWFRLVAIACIATVSAALVWRLSRRHHGKRLEPQVLRAAL